MGDFERTFGVGADAVDIIDRFARQESRENARQKSSDEKKHDSIDNSFPKFIEHFELAYEGYERHGHIDVLLNYAIQRNREAALQLQVQRHKLMEVHRMEKEALPCSLRVEDLEELIAPIARVGIGALMMAGISGEEIRAIYAVLRYGRYSNGGE